MLAAEAGANALGFVFAPSPRQVTRDQVADIVKSLPSSIEKIGVFVDATFSEIEATVIAGQVSGVQLQFAADSDLRSQLRHRFGPRLRILQVLHYDTDVLARAEAFARDPNIDALLVDSRTATAPGGTGIAFDWKAAASTLFRDRSATHKLVAAGGLNPQNVCEAIAMLRPWGVDVVSGVEASPGRKDPGKVRAFIENARAASDGAGCKS